MAEYDNISVKRDYNEGPELQVVILKSEELLATACITDVSNGCVTVQHSTTCSL